MTKPDRDEILRRVREHRHAEKPHEQARPSAVLVPLRELEGRPDALEVILTRRSGALGKHAGQVSFPGGGIDPDDDDATAAALRESHEELGIDPARVEVVGRLDDMHTVTNFHVTQIVGLVPRDITLTPSPDEVARVFTVPLEALLDRDAWQSRLHPYRGRDYRVWHYEWDGEDIWGATATMLRDFMELLWR